MKLRKVAMVVSATLILVSIGSLVTQKLNLGIDFTGGSVVEVGYAEAAHV